MARTRRGGATGFEVLHWQAGVVGPVLPKGTALAVVISALDLDAHSAAQIIALKPHTVLNTEPSYSGRFPARGPVQLVRAGINLVDDLGADILSVPNETKIQIDAGTVSVAGAASVADADSTEDAVLCEGEVRQLPSLEQDQLNAEGGVGEKVTALVGAAALNLRSGTGILSADISEAPVDQVLIFVGQSGQRFGEVRNYLAQHQPTVIAVDEGWHEALERGLRPQYVVLSPGHLVPQVPRRYRPTKVFLLANPGETDRLRPVASQLQQRGWAYHEVATTHSAAHFGLALAGHLRPKLIVWTGPQVTDPHTDLLERTAPQGAAELLLRVELAGKLVDAAAVQAVARPPIGVGWLIGFGVVGLVALATALAVTVFGVDLAQVLGWFDWSGGN